LPASSQSERNAAAGASIALRFVPVGAEHADGLSALFERNRVPQVTALFDPFPLDAAEARRIALARRKDAFYLAFEGELLLGFSMLRGFDEGYEIPSFGIFVDRASHGRGIGRALTAWTVEQARLRGCAAVRLTVYARNLPARRLYESLGFVEQERQGVVCAGQSDEKVVMRLDFGG
jgi:ribosomal protein S18 acetylase RimI-like enzyme